MRIIGLLETINLNVALIKKDIAIAVLTLGYDLAKQVEMANVYELTELYPMASSVNVSFSHAPALAGTSVNCIICLLKFEISQCTTLPHSPF